MQGAIQRWNLIAIAFSISVVYTVKIPVHRSAVYHEKEFLFIVPVQQVR